MYGYIYHSYFTTFCNLLFDSKLLDIGCISMIIMLEHQVTLTFIY